MPGVECCWARIVLARSQGRFRAGWRRGRCGVASAIATPRSHYSRYRSSPAISPATQIPPHTDTHWKGITVQLYLPRDRSNTHIPTIFHEKLADGPLAKVKQMTFAPNTGYAFAVGDDTWHSADRVGPEVFTRDSILLDVFRRRRSAAILPQPRQAVRQFYFERVAPRFALADVAQ